MIEVFVDKNTAATYVKTKSGNYHMLTVQGERTIGLDEKDLIKTGQFCSDIEELSEK